MARGGYQDPGALVPWVSLYEQFGHGYKRIRDFRHGFVRTLKFVKIVYHEGALCPGRGDEAGVNLLFYRCRFLDAHTCCCAAGSGRSCSC